MSKSQKSSDDGDRKVELSAACVDPVPQQLKEVIELMSSINRRLEDCAVDWQSVVSLKQWRFVDAKPLTKRTWENSLLARTYFTDKSLDEAFQSLLVQDRSFTDQLNNFVGLLRGEGPSTIRATVRDAQNQCPDPQSMDCGELSGYPVIAPLDLSLLEDRNPVRKTRKSMRLAAGNSSFNTVQQSFADLIKAKINLDTKFLGFEAILNGTSAAASTNESSCLCQICSNVLGTAVDKGKAIKNIAAVRQKVQRATKAKTKRLTKSSRTWTRRRPKNPTVTLTNIGDQAPQIAVAESYKESVTE